MHGRAVCVRPAGYDGHVRVVYPYVWLQLLPCAITGRGITSSNIRYLIFVQDLVMFKYDARSYIHLVAFVNE